VTTSRQRAQARRAGAGGAAASFGVAALAPWLTHGAPALLWAVVFALLAAMGWCLWRLHRLLREVGL